jgi:hypothetical protein
LQLQEIKNKRVSRILQDPMKGRFLTMEWKGRRKRKSGILGVSNVFVSFDLYYGWGVFFLFLSKKQGKSKKKTIVYGSMWLMRHKLKANSMVQ